jgi:hypothetical protein
VTETTGRHVRIESALDTDKKTNALHHTRIYVGDEDITNDVIAIDWHADARNAPTATVQLCAPQLEVEALEVEFIRTDSTQPEPETLTKYDLGLLKLALVGVGQQLADLQGSRVLCFGCVVERHQGAREHANPATTIVNGQATYLEHLQLVDGTVIPGRTASGLLVPGQGA